MHLENEEVKDHSKFIAVRLRELAAEWITTHLVVGKRTCDFKVERDTLPKSLRFVLLMDPSMTFRGARWKQYLRACKGENSLFTFESISEFGSSTLDAFEPYEGYDEGARGGRSPHVSDNKCEEGRHAIRKYRLLALNERSRKFADELNVGDPDAQLKACAREAEPLYPLNARTLGY